MKPFEFFLAASIVTCQEANGQEFNGSLVITLNYMLVVVRFFPMSFPTLLMEWVGFATRSRGPCCIDGSDDGLWVLRVARKWLDKGYNRTLWSHHKNGKLTGVALGVCG